MLAVLGPLLDLVEVTPVSVEFVGFFEGPVVRHTTVNPSLFSRR
jgi:hypothetical protein